MNPKKRVKGIILAGGYGTRLFPLTIGISKQLLPVYDKPMIYYPLYILMQAGIRDVLIISTKEELPRFKKLFGNGSKLGIEIDYKNQDEPRGIAEAFIIGNKFISNDNVVLILGDNIFFGKNFKTKLNEAKKHLENGISSIFTKEVENPNDFGVIKFDANNQIEKIIEKPKINIGKNVVCGIYFYTNEVIEISRKLKPSERGELEITDINNYFLKTRKLNAILLDEDIIWSDVGTYDSLLKISRYFYDYEKEFKKKVACIEELALSLGYISESEFLLIANHMINSDYGKYLIRKIENN
tara:strand:+ start:1271 stop:2164 length:894 start_codon:yes stop_codon:yes gene_type:complete